MSDLIFSKRMELEKEYLEWVKVAGLADCASNVIVFLIGKGLIQDRQDGPVYYLLRRTVGVTTMHYQYLAHGHMWLNEITHKSFWCKADAELFAADFNERRDGTDVEIIPVKLLEVTT